MIFLVLEVKMSEKTGLKRKKFDISFKLSAVDRVKNGEKQCEVCRDLGINEATLRGWIRSEATVRETTLQLDESEGLSRKRLRLAKDGDLDQALYHWFVQKRSDGAPITGPMVMKKAGDLDKQLNGNESTFRASSGWLMRWKKRHRIGCNAISGEIKSADNEAADAYPLKLRDILEEGGYNEDQVYNCDETGLMFKMLPRKTLSVKKDPTKHEGAKEAKDRVTILLTVNKTGDHKLKPLCIGKFKNPRAFHHVNRDVLPCVYDYSKNAWMTSVIFENWFHSEFVPAVRRYLLGKNMEPKALLLLDNCPAHPPAENLISRCGKIKVSYLPKNTTSRIQPLDQGIIATLKCNYRHLLLSKLIDDDIIISECLKKVNVKEVIYHVGNAWDHVFLHLQ